jgi:hypothetical protein
MVDCKIVNFRLKSQNCGSARVKDSDSEIDEEIKKIANEKMLIVGLPSGNVQLKKGGR